MKRREKERAVADAFHDVKVLINRFVRRGLRSDVVGQALLIGAAFAAYDAKLDDLEFSDNAFYAFAIAEAIRTGRKTVDTPVDESWTGMVN